MTVANDTLPRSTPHFDEMWTTSTSPANPLDFAGYEPPASEDESVRAGLAHAPRGPYVLIECAFARAGGTMGIVAGDTVVAAYER
ncbi:hypothetical protein, partial [Microbacterium sp.]|uniref:hypothetical protein n=1 Tax=Microbacterium sp. TaxID=51671 RepID=UPI002733E3EF